MWIVLLSIIFVLLIAAVLYGGYYAYNHYVKNDDTEAESTQTTQTDSNDSQSKSDSTSKGPRIDIFSSDFDKII